MSFVHALGMDMKSPEVRAARDTLASTVWMFTFTPIFAHSSFKMTAVLILSLLLPGTVMSNVNPFGTVDAAINCFALSRLKG